MSAVQPKISIIVPVYNCQDYLPRCIDSLIHQTLECIEIILINDGSTDDSLRICCEYAVKDPRITVMDQPNGGAAKARVTGIRAAHGQYVAFVDSDDWISPEYCSYLYDQAKQTGADIVQCNYLHADGTETPVGEESGKTDVRIYPARQATLQLLGTGHESGFSFVLWAKLFRRNLFDDLELPEHPHQINDVPVVARVFSRAKNAAITERKLYYYFCRSNPENPSTMDLLNQKEDRFIYSHIEAFDNVSSFFEKRDRELYLASLKHTVQWALSALIRKNSSPECRRYAVAVIKKAQIWENPFIPWKKKLAALAVKIMLH